MITKKNLRNISFTIATHNFQNEHLEFAGFIIGATYQALLPSTGYVLMKDIHKATMILQTGAWGKSYDLPLKLNEWNIEGYFYKNLYNHLKNKNKFGKELVVMIYFE